MNEAEKPYTLRPDYNEVLNALILDKKLKKRLISELEGGADLYTVRKHLKKGILAAVNKWVQTLMDASIKFKL